METYDAEQIMFVQKSFGLASMAKFTGHHVVWLTAWAGLVAVLYEYTQWEWITIPWLPLSVIGTAVAFYLGFKNNSAYDRLWEARKIWGAIVNSSRSWGAAVRGFVSNQFTADDRSDEGLRSVQRELIYRHISWLYALRSQLLIPTPRSSLYDTLALRADASKSGKPAFIQDRAYSSPIWHTP